MKKLIVLLIPLFLVCGSIKSQTWSATSPAAGFTVAKDTVILLVNDKTVMGVQYYLEVWWSTLSATTGTGNLLIGGKTQVKSSWLHKAAGGTYSDTFQLAPATFRRVFTGNMETGTLWLGINKGTVGSGTFYWNFFAKKD